MRKISCCVITPILIVALIIGGFFYGKTQLGALSPNHNKMASVTVTVNEDPNNLAKDLASKGLIKSSLWFGLYARFKNISSHLNPGTYNLDSGMSANEVINILEGPATTITKRLVLSEGLTAKQMAQKVADLGVGISAADYMNEVNSGSFSESFLSGRVSGDSLEGFLFPDTYQIPAGATAHQIVQMQLDDFASQAFPQLQTPYAGQSLYQTLIIASMIEREARFVNDRAIVASVIDNRLARGMRLQIDATILYGLGIVGRGPTAAELQSDNPYNTNLHTGLPPTPISNPGLASLMAAVQPTQTQYLYYLSDNCGHNHYSATLSQHQQQIRLYLGSSAPPCTGTN